MSNCADACLIDGNWPLRDVTTGVAPDDVAVPEPALHGHRRWKDALLPTQLVGTPTPIREHGPQWCQTLTSPSRHGASMRITSATIRNFRCLQEVSVDFDQVTSLVGSNGSGKSSVLRALDWFFNGEKGDLTDDDIYSGAGDQDRKIEVEVSFSELTASDRATLGDKYAPASVDTFTVWRTWADGDVKTTGKGRAYPAFEGVRAHPSAAEKKREYNDLRDARPELALPPWRNQADAFEAMLGWERSNPEMLEDALVESTHFFGFNGRNLLSGLFDFVLVTADLRAGEESLEGKKTIIGRILERAIDHQAASEAFDALARDVSERQIEINKTFLDQQLVDLSAELTGEVAAFTQGRGVALRSKSPDYRPTPPLVSVTILDSPVETSVDRQGHGFQRALLIAALKLLATRSSQGSDSSVIHLAIEEPELFQHPGQARVFAKVLRDLAATESTGLQIAYATHSPYFIDARYFDQVRRVTRDLSDGSTHPVVQVKAASLTSITLALDGIISTAAITSRWHQVCTNNLSEALFSDAVVLVEGEDDKGVLDGLASRTTQLEALGVTVAPARGKNGLFLPYVILRELGIPALVVFDSDSGGEARGLANGNSTEQIAQSRTDEVRTNRSLMNFLGHPEVDYPSGLYGTNMFVWSDRLEEALNADWPSWETTRNGLVSDGRGARGKNAATYELAAAECSVEPKGAFVDLMNAARALVGGAA